MSIIQIKDEPTGMYAPGQGEDGKPIAQPAPELTGTEKALADTKAELTKAQQELAELRKAASPQPPAPKAAEGTPPAEGSEPAPKTAEGKALEITDEQVEQVQAMDFSEYQQEFTQTMDVSEEGREAIAEKIKGVFGDRSRQLVDDYIAGAKVRTENAVNSLMDAAGGKDQYNEMVEWARGTLTREEKQAFNNQLNSGDMQAANLAITGLRYKFENQSGRAPKLLDGSGMAASGGVYKTTAEMQADMRDPRYKTDATFRQQVQDKLMRSDIL